jgi:DNA-binding transcriptional MerR regulator
MSKSPDAFRTIREVADWLGVAAHVLRFWESKFPQVRPVKRAGGRRYYRPSDMELLGGIKVLLHDRGMTVRGVQRLLREEGAAAVAALSPSLDSLRVAPELVEGIGEDEEAWRADAEAEAEATPPAVDDTMTEAPPSLPGFEAAEDVLEEREAGSEPEPEPESELETEPEPEAAVAETATPEPVLPVSDVLEPVGAAEMDAAPDPVLLDAGMPEAATPDAPANGEPPAPWPNGGLDRLALFVARTRDATPEGRARIRPAISRLRRLKERMETPVDGTGG